MTSSAVDTFEKLKERNTNSVWLWSMMLTRGMTWDNVWDIFTGGVSTDSTGRDNSLVPGVDALFSLPNSPSNVLELFSRLGQLRAQYPKKESGGYIVLGKDNLSDELFRRARGYVQCTWPQVKTILDATRQLTDDGQRHDLNTLVTRYIAEKPSLRAKTLLHMVQTQHQFVGTYTFAVQSKECEPETIKDLWEAMQAQTWSEPINTQQFMGLFFHGNHAYNIPIAQSLSFIEKHPEIIPDITRAIQAYALHNPEDEAFFDKARSLFAGHPGAFIDLYFAMDKELSLAVLSGSNMHLQAEKVEIKPMLRAYLSIPSNERDTPEAQTYFANIFQRVAVSMEGFMNEHSNPWMAKAIESNPTGVMARILAFHACSVALFPGNCRESEIKEIKSLFRHDPRSKTGHAAIIKKFIPDFKEWFAMVQSLGLSRSDVWTTGLQKMAADIPDISMHVDGAVFDAVEF